MGSACCSDGYPGCTGQVCPDEIRKTDCRQPIITSINTDPEYNVNDSDYPPSNNSLSFIEYDARESVEKAINGFKVAVQNGDDSLVMHFIEEYPFIILELLNAQFENGNNALHIAVLNKSYNLILYLLTAGFSPNRQNDIGESSLHSAVQINNLKIVTLLTKYAADPSIENINNETPLTIATANKYYDIVCLLSPQTQYLLLTYIERVTDIERHDHDHEADPFIDLKRIKTKVALQQIHDITCEKNKLPKLEAFLEKRQGQIPYRLQRRWVIVKDSYILWSDIQRNITDTKKVKEREKFNNSINLMAITNIQPVTKGKTQRKFVIEVVGYGVKNKKQQYLWKCSTKNERDLWVQGLRDHIKHLKSIISYLGAND